mgnify:FL=1
MSPTQRPSPNGPTTEQILEAVQDDDNSGFCLACGAQAYGVEPDARRYECEECGARKVYGAEECLIMCG